MWLGPIHDPEFCARVIKSIDADKEQYGTWPRMHGMLSLAMEVSFLIVFEGGDVCPSV
jgi:tRNA (guanine26-N2/guanine27-N2)-dimethyltransferase